MNPLLQNVYVINLEKDKQRFEKVSKNLSKYDIPFKRIEAVDGSKLTNEELEKVSSLTCRHLLCSKGIIALGLSHMKVWRIIAQSSEPWHLILEDDVHFRDDSVDKFNLLHKDIEKYNINAYINVNCHNINGIGCGLKMLQKC